MSAAILYIGNKNYSSWSMRPWLALKWGGIAFQERVIPLGGMGYGKSKIPEILEVSPSGRVPALHVDGVTIYDSLSIAEWAAEQAPHLWPKDSKARALARSAACEMHAGFSALRGAMSMNVKRRTIVPQWPADVAGDLERIIELWLSARAIADGGPYLFGARSIADAFYAPVATRFRTYGVSLPPIARAYCQTLFDDDAFKEWEDGALSETWALPQTDGLYA